MSVYGGYRMVHRESHGGRASSTARTAQRRWFLDSVALLFGAALLGFGIVLVLDATRTRDGAKARERAAMKWATTVHSRASASIARNHDLATRLRANQTRLRDLQRAQATDFSSAIKVGQDRGTRAGTAAGTTAGKLAARVQRSNISKTGWYYVQIIWSNGLPTITKVNKLIPGSTRAYYIDNGTPWRRDTTTP